MFLFQHSRYFRISILVELGKFVVRAKHFLNLVAIKLNHKVACRTAILTWVKLCRLLVEYLTNSSGESKTRVRVDINLTNSTLSSLTKLLFWNTYCIWQLTTVSVDDINILLRN